MRGILKLFRRRTLLGECEQCACLYAFCAESHGCEHSLARCYSACCYERLCGCLAHLRYQSHRCSLFASVVAACLKAFGNDGVDACLLAFCGKLAARHYVSHLYSGFVQHRGELLRTACRREHNLYAFVYYHLHESVYLGIHQRNVHAPRLVGCSFHLVYVLKQRLRVHRACSEQSQTAGIAHGRSQSPAAAPHHTALNYGIFNAEKFGYSVIFHKHFLFL